MSINSLIKLKEYVFGKSVSIIGLGISNRPLIDKLYNLGAILSIRDKNEAIISKNLLDEYRKKGIRIYLGDHYLDELTEDIILRTPGLKPSTPELINAKKHGAIITSEMQLFFQFCDSKIIGVTGSDGKTTTTTLIYEILSKEGFNCFKGGNIGQPLLPIIETISEKDIVVVELSSFQLMDMTVSPDIAVITNISPNHLDYHKNYDEYINAKKNIYLYQKSNSLFVTNINNDITRKLITDNTITFGYENRFRKCRTVYFKDNNIYYFNGLEDNLILNANEINIPGMHNVENYMAAIAATIDLVSINSIRDTAHSFKGVEHRIEFVREINKVKFFNDSIASSPTRTMACLNSFNQKIILIAGGYDKNLDYTTLGHEINKKVKSLILVGNTSEKIYKSVINASNYSGIPIQIFKDFSDAVKYSNTIAVQGDIVVLSPASASFDLFKNFEERGRFYKSIVEGF